MADQAKQQQQFLRLVVNCGGYAVIKDIRKLLDKDGKENGNLGVTFAYEGGSASLTVPRSMMPDYQPGEVVELWFSVEGCDCGFDWQGKHIAKDGFRILGLTQIKRIQ